MIETFKTLHGYYDDNCLSSLFTFKDTITRDINFQSGHDSVKLTLEEISLLCKVTNLCNSLPGYVVESPSVNSFKIRLDKYCRSKGIMFSTDIVFVDIYTLSVLLKSDKV